MMGPEETIAPREVARLSVPGGALRRAWRMAGGVSAEVTGLEIVGAGGETVRLVVRRHGATDLAANPRVAREEYRLLSIARAHELAVPRPYLFDESGETLPSPYLVVGLIDGEPDPAPVALPEWLDQAAAQLAAIHRVPAMPDLAFLPPQRADPGDSPPVPDESMGESRIRSALAVAGAPPAPNGDVFLHGDFWPGNLLWRGGELAGVIDWEDARTGDPLADVANARLEILWAFGEEAMAGFTGRYRARCAAGLDWSGLAVWDLIMALRPCGKLASWGLDAEAEGRMRERHARFVGRAIDRLRVG